MALRAMPLRHADITKVRCFGALEREENGKRRVKKI